MGLQAFFLSHQRFGDGLQGLILAIAAIHDAGQRGVVDARTPRQFGGRHHDGLKPGPDLTWRDDCVHISTANVIWCGVSSVEIDSAMVFLPLHKSAVKQSQKSTPQAVTEKPVDERTLAFRQWIAAMLAKNNITKTELSRRARLSHSLLSRATTDDRHKINFRSDTITRLAEAGGIRPPDIILGHSTAFEGLSEAEATPYSGQASRTLTPNQSIWMVKSTLLSPVGLVPGDRFILDQSLKPRNYDLVMVQKYDHQRASADTMLRIYDAGFAVTPLHLIDRSPKLWIDGSNVVSMGVVIESWRTRD